MYNFSLKSETTRKLLKIVNLLLELSKTVKSNTHEPLTVQEEFLVANRILYLEGINGVGLMADIFLNVSNSIIDLLAPVSKIALTL